MLLSECPTKTALRLGELNLPAASVLRMQELGVRPGVLAVITQRAGFGGLVLNVAGSRLAIDHRSARLITAEMVA